MYSIASSLATFYVHSRLHIRGTHRSLLARYDEAGNLKRISHIAR